MNDTAPADADAELDAISRELRVGKYYDLAQELEDAANAIALTNQRSEGVRISVAMAYHAAGYIRDLRAQAARIAALEAENAHLRKCWEEMIPAGSSLSYDAIMRYRAEALGISPAD
jgi:hypothetical protein